MAAGAGDKKRDEAEGSEAGAEQPTKKEQKEALKTANESELATRPTGESAPNEWGQDVPTLAPETEYERSIRVNHRADRFPFEEPDETRRRVARELRKGASE